MIKVVQLIIVETNEEKINYMTSQYIVSIITLLFPLFVNSQTDIDSSCYCLKFVKDTNYICEDLNIRRDCLSYYFNKWEKEKTHVKEVKRILGSTCFETKNKRFIKNHYNYNASSMLYYLGSALCDEKKHIYFPSGSYYQLFFSKKRLLKIENMNIP